MNENTEATITKAKREIANASTHAALSSIHNEYLGNNGIVTRSTKIAHTLPRGLRELRIDSAVMMERVIADAIEKKRKQLKK